MSLTTVAAAMPSGFTEVKRSLTNVQVHVQMYIHDIAYMYIYICVRCSGVIYTDMYMYLFAALPHSRLLSSVVYSTSRRL